MSVLLRLGCLGLLAGAAMAASAADIYVCVDAKGRKLTSDRPMAECADREQKELNPSGTVRRVIPPTPTASERAALEEKERKAQEERQRLAELKRVQKLLLARYPNRVVHDTDRGKALRSLDEVIASAQKRIVDLRDERKKLDQEAEFYQGPSKWPPKLKAQVEDNEQQIAAQQRFIAAQGEEKQRVNARFDQELAQLKQLWAQNGATTAATEAPAVTR
jgi:chromosome segregation ATPase